MSIIRILSFSLLFLISIGMIGVGIAMQTTNEYKNINILDLKIFLFADNVNSIKTVERVVDNNGEIIHEGFTCYDYTRMLQSNAKYNNINMGVVYIRDDYFFDSDTNLHTVNYVIIDDEIYIIEPQTDEIMKIEDIKNRYSSNYVTLINMDDEFYPRTININSKGVAYNFPLEVDFNLSGE